jgi:uncharacterized membrane protein
MAERIKQVAITYVTHRYIWAGALFLVAVAGPMYIGMSGQQNHPREIAPSMVFAIGIPPLFLARFLVGHAKSQFGQWQARLTPDFLPSHVAILSACLILLLGAYPLLLARHAQASPLGFIAYALAVATPAIWVLHRGYGFGFLFSLVVLYSAITDWGAHWWVADAAEHWYFHAAIIAVCVILLAAWVRRLCDLTEEMPDFRNSMNWRVARPGGGEVIEQRRAAAAKICRSPLITRISDFWLSRLPAADDRRARPALTRLLSYGFGAWTAEFSSLFTGFLMAAVTWFMADFAVFAHAGDATMLHIFSLFTIYMPAYSGGELLAQRRPRVATELFRPLTRAQLVDGLFISAARSTLLGWLVQNVLLAIVAWHILGSQLTPWTVASYALISATAAFAILGLSLRISVYPSQFKRLLAVVAPWCVAAAVASGFMARNAAIAREGATPPDHFYLWPILPIVAALLIAVGVLLVASARKAWLNLELGK